MCGPKAPRKSGDVQEVPIRSTAMLPDNGDPAVRLGLRAKRTLSTSSAILANRNGALALPNVTGPQGIQTTAIAGTPMLPPLTTPKPKSGAGGGGGGLGLGSAQVLRAAMLGK